jgi:hypothetical protein
MPLITPKIKQDTIAIKLQIKADIIDEIKAYYDYSNMDQKEGYNGFFEQAALYILKKDTGFKKWKKSQKI